MTGTKPRNRIFAAVSEVRSAQPEKGLLAIEPEVDAIIGDKFFMATGAIEEEDLAAY